MCISSVKDLHVFLFKKNICDDTVNVKPFGFGSSQHDASGTPWYLFNKTKDKYMVCSTQPYLPNHRHLVDLLHLIPLHTFSQSVPGAPCPWTGFLLVPSFSWKHAFLFTLTTFLKHWVMNKGLQKIVPEIFVFCFHLSHFTGWFFAANFKHYENVNLQKPQGGGVEQTDIRRRCRTVSKTLGRYFVL